MPRSNRHATVVCTLLLCLNAAVALSELSSKRGEKQKRKNGKASARVATTFLCCCLFLSRRSHVEQQQLSAARVRQTARRCFVAALATHGLDIKARY